MLGFIRGTTEKSEKVFFCLVFFSVFCALEEKDRKVNFGFFLFLLCCIVLCCDVLNCVLLFCVLCCVVLYVCVCACVRTRAHIVFNSFI